MTAEFPLETPLYAKLRLVFALLDITKPPSNEDVFDHYYEEKG
jgi:hypothetical protein